MTVKFTLTVTPLNCFQSTLLDQLENEKKENGHNFFIFQNKYGKCYIIEIGEKRPFQ